MEDIHVGIDAALLPALARKTQYCLAVTTLPTEWVAVLIPIQGHLCQSDLLQGVSPLRALGRSQSQFELCAPFGCIISPCGWAPTAERELQRHCLRKQNKHTHSKPKAIIFNAMLRCACVFTCAPSAFYADAAVSGPLVHWRPQLLPQLELPLPPQLALPLPLQPVLPPQQQHALPLPQQRWRLLLSPHREAGCALLGAAQLEASQHPRAHHRASALLHPRQHLALACVGYATAASIGMATRQLHSCGSVSNRSHSMLWHCTGSHLGIGTACRLWVGC